MTIVICSLCLLFVHFKFLSTYFLFRTLFRTEMCVEMSSQDDFWEHPFIADSGNEVKKHEHVSAKNEKNLLKRYEIGHQRLIDLLDPPTSERRQRELVSSSRKLQQGNEVLESKVMKAEELNIKLHEERNILHSQYGEKQNEIPVLAQEVAYLKEKLTTVEKDAKSEMKQSTNLYKSVIHTKEAYKKAIGCHIRLLKTTEGENQFLFTFGSIPQPAKNESLPSKFAKFLLTPEEKIWKLLETKPPLSNFDSISKTFEESQDIQGFLSYLGSSFKSKKQI